VMGRGIVALLVGGRHGFRPPSASRDSLVAVM